MLGVLCGLHPLVDVVLQRAFDVMLAFTALILGVTLAAILGPGTAAVFWTVAGINVPLFGRITRNAVRLEKDREYVLAAQALGAGRLRVLVGDILPNIGFGWPNRHFLGESKSLPRGGKEGETTDLSALRSFTFSRPQYEESLRTAAARQQSASGHTSS